MIEEETLLLDREALELLDGLTELLDGNIVIVLDITAPENELAELAMELDCMLELEGIADEVPLL